MMNKRTRNIIVLIMAVVLVVLGALFAGAWLYASQQLSRLDTYKESILKVLSGALERNVTYETGKATLTFREGLSIEFTHLVIWEKDSSAEWFSIDSAAFRVDFFPLLAKRVVLREAVLKQPHLSLKRDQNGVLNIADLLNRQKKPEMSLDLKKVTVENGLLTFIDQRAGAKGLKTSLTDLQCRIDPKRFGDASRFRLIAALHENESKGTLMLAGTFLPAPWGKPIRESKLEASVRLTGMDLHHYRFYLHDHESVEQLDGRLDLEAVISGTITKFMSKGTLSVKDALLACPHVFQKSLRPRILQADYILTRDGGDLKLEVPRLVVDRVALAGRLDLRGMDQKDPLLEAAAATSVFSLKEMNAYIPWGIIPSDLGGFIKAHVTGGNFRLVEGRLQGSLSRISDMMRKENAGLLSIRAEVDGGIFTVGAGGAPDFSDISGTLELKNRQFSLSNMKGRFGASPCSLDGFISDFALPGALIYTAKMSLQPAREEVVWLLGKDRFPKLGFDGTSIVLLSGTGPANDFHISALWDLTGAAYRHEDIVEKPNGQHNRITAELIINEDAFKVPSFEYDLPPAKVRGSATYLFKGKSPLSVTLSSDRMDIRTAVSILPDLRKFDPAGSCRIRLGGRSDPGGTGAFLWRGDVSFTDVSFKPAEAVKPVSGFTGVAAFKGDRMETSLLQARIGESIVQGKCRMRNFRGAGLTCRFSTPHLQAEDVGLHGADGDVGFREVQTQFTAGADRLHVDRLSLTLGTSMFIFSGDVPDPGDPRVTIKLTSPYIHSDDAFRLMSLKSSKQTEAASAGMDLDLNLQVDAGVFNGLGFRKLNADLKYAQGTLNIEALEAGILDGRLKGKGSVAIRPDGRHQYKVTFALEQASMEKFKEFLNIGDRTLTGNWSLAGEVAAAGSGMDDFIRTANGSFQIRAEKGVLKKFSVLAKIFSLLNVSQLFKLQLPDMVEDGMPYTSITASLTLTGGVLSSQDLLINSNAMQISIVGNTDLVQKKLEGIVGIHPLRTLDLITARIPIAGWVLTDEKGHLVTVHFEVKGDWDNPEVSPIPAKSLAKGTLDIFRRLFQLPEKMVTDTGDVILGR